MTGLIEMMLMKAMFASAAREGSRRRKRNARARGRPITWAVCRTIGGTMYKHGDGYICRDCKNKKKKEK